MTYKHILLVDDDTEDQEIFETALELVGENLQCTSFSNAKDALHKLVAGEVNPDVIFLDLNMPVMSGQEFLMKIKKQDGICDIPVIIFSTSSNQNTIKQMKELGAVDFLTKPSRFDTLVDSLKPIINRQF